LQFHLLDSEAGIDRDAYGAFDSRPTHFRQGAEPISLRFRDDNIQAAPCIGVAGDGWIDSDIDSIFYRPEEMYWLTLFYNRISCLKGNLRNLFRWSLGRKNIYCNFIASNNSWWSRKGIVGVVTA
jgi:hypothetical protein